MRRFKQIGSGVVQTIAYHCLPFHTLTQQLTVKHDKYCLRACTKVSIKMQG
jgi:hypothetical protein